MPGQSPWLGRTAVFFLLLSLLEFHHKTQASSLYRYKQEREITDEDIDSLIDEYRKLRLQKEDEIAKEKPILSVYNGLRHPKYPYGASQRSRGHHQGEGHYRGQEPWDRGEGVLNEQVYDHEPVPDIDREEIRQRLQRPRVFSHRYRQQDDREQLQEQMQEQLQEQMQEKMQEKMQEQENMAQKMHGMEEEMTGSEPESPPEEHVHKESSPDSAVRIEPVPEYVEEEDKPVHPTPAARQEVDDKLHPMQEVASMADIYFLAVVAGCSVAGLVGLVVAGVCWYRLQKNVKAASEVEYPAYGITGPTKETVGSPGDRKLAQSAQMYHYQHQKQQMIALEKANGEMNHAGSEDDSDEENEEGDYTVYECPGLAPTGEMEVKNPLFSEETPVTPTPDDRRDLK